MKKIICFILAIMLVFSTAIVSSVFALSMLYGDVNEDNTVSIIDVTQIQYHIVGSHTLSDSQLILADVDRDASVNIVDATIIQRYLVKKVDSLPLVPTKVPNVKATALSDSEIQVSWSLISGAQKYWVYVNDVVYTSTTADSFIVSRRAPDTPYEIYVTAMVDNSVILSKDDADILTVTTLPDPNAPNIKDTASKISKLQSNTTLTLSLMADTHFECGQTEKLKAYEEFGKIQDHVNIDFAANLGDAVNGKSTKEQTLEDIKWLTYYTSQYCKSPLYFVRGNHDDNGWYSFGNYGGTYKTDEIINHDEWYDVAVKDYQTNVVTDKTNPKGGYGYYDDTDSKTRIFFLNTSDIPYIVEDDGTYRYNSYQDACISNAQLNFVADALLFEDKENPEKWGTVFLSHIPLDSSNADNERFGGKMALPKGANIMLAIINAYHKGTAFEFSGSSKNKPTDIYDDFLVDVKADYSQKGCGEVIAFFSGHTHTDNFCDTVNVEESLSYGFTYIGVNGSYSFANFIIDRENKTINAVKHGESVPEKTQGTLAGTPDIGSIESGEWAVYYGKELPNGKNLFSGASDIWGSQYSIAGKLDTTTLELISPAKASSENNKLSKATFLKPLTNYTIPDDFVGSCMLYSKSGSAIQKGNIIDHGDYKTFQTTDYSAYVVFNINTDEYENYDEFFIKETFYSN